ncbi:MAG: EamA family transporter [Gemmatimonadetes bacterium]|nr:EamA family transporter [Gemmatimonadota bacterium]
MRPDLPSGRPDVSPEALTLVLAAGLVHASWNLILKRSEDPLIVGAASLLAGSLLFAPVLVGALPVPRAVWPYVSTSALVMVAYYGVLGHAYRRGDFSLVYPVARGSAPALIALWATLFLGERPSPRGLSGIGLILLGLVVLGGGPLWIRRRDWKNLAPGLFPAFVVAVLISIYSVVDGAGVRLWEPAPYVVLTFALGGGMLVPALWLRDPPRVKQVVRRSWRSVVVIAGLTLLAYSMVLRAYQIAPIAYAGAAREIGIVFGALAGWLILGERFGGFRTVGAVLVFAGIGVLATA